MGDKAVVNRTFRVIYYYRKAQQSKSKFWKRLYEIKYRKFRDKYGIEIPPSAKIGRGLLMIHPYNITINRDAVIANNFTILKGATVGNSKTGWIYQCAESACPVFWKSPVRKEEIMVSDR